MSGAALNFVHTNIMDYMFTAHPIKSFVDPEQYVFDTFTNLSSQMFRVDQTSRVELRATQETVFDFTIPNLGDVLKDTFFVMNLPDIFSPLWPPSQYNNGQWAPSEVKWIRDLIVAMSRVEIICGTTSLANYSGHSIKHLIERDRSPEMRAKFDEITGNVPELFDPANVHGRSGAYPSCLYQNGPCEPSIRGRTISFPLHTFFCELPGFPLYKIKTNELRIRITIRPLKELLQVRDVYDAANGFPYLAPDQTKDQFLLHRFVQSPQDVDVAGPNAYPSTQLPWNSDAHLECHVILMTEEERQATVNLPWQMLVREIHEYKTTGIASVGTNYVPVRSTSGVTHSWLWYGQRSDIGLRNEWTNYTNWPYKHLPINVRFAPTESLNNLFPAAAYNSDGTNTGFFISGPLAPENQKEIIITSAIVLDGAKREEIAPSSRFTQRTRYGGTKGQFVFGVNSYLFCLNSDADDKQPNGAAPLSEFKNVNLEVATIIPTPATPGQFIPREICGTTGAVIGYNTLYQQMYDYTFDITVIEERFNVVNINSGICALMFVR